MFPFKQSLVTNNKTKGVNTKEFIIVHHTATWEGSIKGVLKTLTTGAVSCHFVIDTNGDAYKIGQPDDILWHAWESEWGDKKWMNYFSLGIEVIGPLADGWFTRAQFITLTRLVEHLMAAFNIPKDNVIRHKDITHLSSKKKVLWTVGTRSRKVDPYDTLFQNSNFLDWRNALTPNKV